MRPKSLKLPGSFKIELSTRSDHRGSFIKTFASSVFAQYGLAANFVETFYTVSQANVVRGMHFQVPPHDHAKLVYCTAGRVLDLALDLRAGSPAFGLHEAVGLDSASGDALYLPSGLAHGFAVLEAPAVMVYHVTSEYAQSADAGVHWQGFGAHWPFANPVISDRDQSLPSFADFVTPFRYSQSAAAGRA